MGILFNLRVLRLGQLNPFDGRLLSSADNVLDNLVHVCFAWIRLLWLRENSRRLCPFLTNEGVGVGENSGRKERVSH